MKNRYIILIVALVTVIVFSALLVFYLMPDDNEDAYEHCDTDTSNTYNWKSDYHYYSYTMKIDREDFKKSMLGREIRFSCKITNPYDLVDPEDKYIVQTSNYLKGITESKDDKQTVKTITDFVCSAIKYKTDDELYGTTERWAKPMETLYLHAGDCEDKAILLCSLLIACGYDAVLIDFPQHMAVLCVIEGQTGYEYEHNDKTYYYIESTTDSAYIGAKAQYDEWTIWDKKDGVVKNSIERLVGAWRMLLHF